MRMKRISGLATAPSPTTFVASGSVRSRAQNSKEYCRKVGGAETITSTTKPQQRTSCVPQMLNGGMHCSWMYCHVSITNSPAYYIFLWLDLYMLFVNKFVTGFTACTKMDRPELGRYSLMQSIKISEHMELLIYTEHVHHMNYIINNKLATVPLASQVEVNIHFS